LSDSGARRAEMASDFAGDPFRVGAPALDAFSLWRPPVVDHQCVQGFEKFGDGIVARRRTDSERFGHGSLLPRPQARAGGRLVTRR
jgi:hypothetical protein